MAEAKRRKWWGWFTRGEKVSESFRAQVDAELKMQRVNDMDDRLSALEAKLNDVIHLIQESRDPEQSFEQKEAEWLRTFAQAFDVPPDQEGKAFEFSAKFGAQMGERLRNIADYLEGQGTEASQ